MSCRSCRTVEVSDGLDSKVDVGKMGGCDGTKSETEMASRCDSHTSMIESGDSSEDSKGTMTPRGFTPAAITPLHRVIKGRQGQLHSPLTRFQTSILIDQD